MESIETRYLVAAIVVITSALVFYTVGVWSERMQKQLKGWHLACFLIGIVTDMMGTSLMADLVRITGKDDELHQITGLIAIGVMALHAVWALWIYTKGTTKAKRNFNKFSIVVWCIWMIPYCIGVYLGITSDMNS